MPPWRRGPNEVDVLKQGWVGLVLFCAALVLMPALVFGYDKGASRDDEVRASPSPTAATTMPLPVGTGILPAPRPVLAFAGIQTGQPIAGFRRIEINSLSYTGPLNWVLNGPIEPYQISLAQPPYIFAPGPDQGWQTDQVPNGQYTLTAIPIREPDMAISVSFTVSNRVSVSG